jgi:hypothetical protein
MNYIILVWHWYADGSFGDYLLKVWLTGAAVLVPVYWRLAASRAQGGRRP